MTKLTERILHLIYTTKCIFCNKLISSSKIKICDECLEKLPYQSKYCRVCGTPLDIVYGDNLCNICRKKNKPYKRVYTPLIYKDNVRKAIINFKFHGKRSYALTFAQLLFIQLKKEGYFPEAITYVPIHFRRFGKRGYNQTRLIALHLARMFNVPLLKLLKKSRYTPPLSKMSAAMRKKIVTDTFSPTDACISGMDEVLLIDDIITTSSTATECAAVIKKHYGIEVSVATIAATPYVV